MHPYLLFVLIPVATTAGLVATVWKLIAKIDEHTSMERGQLTMRALLLLVVSVGATLWLVYDVHENCSYVTLQEFVDCVEVIHG